ncbi:MAG: efflux RND transporter periplasmic adaptor subunit [Steroidobacteraceae bacterium]|jgi:multidrug resistance efflux pump
MLRRSLPSTTLPLLLVLASALTLPACGSHATGAQPSATKTSAVPPSAYAAIANGKVDVEGGVVEVAARRAGVVSEVFVKEGDVVRKGQVLARQEDEDMVLAVNSARAAVAQAQSQAALNEINVRIAQRELERLKKVAPSNLIAQQQIDQAGDAVATAQAQLEIQKAAVASMEAQLQQAVYNHDLTIIRAPMDGKIIRRYANPGAGASTLNVSIMFDLEPAIPYIIRAEIIESAIPDVFVGQDAEITPESDPSKVAIGKVLRIAGTFGAQKLKSDSATDATDERVVQVVVSTENAQFLIGQRVLVKFMKKGEQAGTKRDAVPAKR